MMEIKSLSLIELKSIYKTYQQGDHQRDVLKDINLSVNEGEFVAIVGPSGCGKSTLMHIMGLLDEPTRGEYILQGRRFNDLTPDQLAVMRNSHIGFVFQFFYLLPRLSAVENVMLPLLYQDVPTIEAKKRAMEWLHKFGVENLADRRPQQLSGGQQQRIAIVRALVTHPVLLLADEPTGSLDSENSEEVMRILSELHAHTKKTIVIITHNNELANRCQRIIHLQDGQIKDDHSV